MDHMWSVNIFVFKVEKTFDLCCLRMYLNPVKFFMLEIKVLQSFWFSFKIERDALNSVEGTYNTISFPFGGYY